MLAAVPVVATCVNIAGRTALKTAYISKDSVANGSSSHRYTLHRIVHLHRCKDDTLT